MEQNKSVVDYFHCCNLPTAISLLIRIYKNLFLIIFKVKHVYFIKQKNEAKLNNNTTDTTPNHTVKMASNLWSKVLEPNVNFDIWIVLYISKMALNIELFIFLSGNILMVRISPDLNQRTCISTGIWIAQHILSKSNIVSKLD